MEFPRFREPVYRGGDGESWGEITDSFSSEPVSWPQELYGYFEVYDPIHTGFG